MKNKFSATAQALFWSLPMMAPFSIAFALISYQAELFGDDGGAAISSLTLLCSLISLIIAVILTVKRHRAKPPRIPQTASSRIWAGIALHILGAFAVSAVELYIVLAALFVRPAYLGFPALIFGALLCFCCFVLIRNTLLYEKPPRRKGSLLLLICVGYLVFYLLTVKRALTLLALSVGDRSITADPWCLLFLLLCLIFAHLLRKKLREPQNSVKQ